MSNSHVLAHVLALVLLAGCPSPGPETCEYQEECAPDVCARDHQCTPRSETREVTVRWTVGGEPASEASCGARDSFTLTFFGDYVGDEVSFDPVPCRIGQFFVDLLPLRFRGVQIGSRGYTISDDGTVMGDLTPR